MQERDQRGDIGQHAPRPAGGRLIRFIAANSKRALGVVQQALDRFHLAADDGADRLGQAQARPSAYRLCGQRGQPALQGRALASAEQRLDVPLDQPRRPSGVPGCQRVPDGGIAQIMLIGPGGRGPVQLWHPAGLLLLQAGAEQTGEQMVVAPPAAHLVQRHQEQARPLDVVQHRLATSPAGDRVTQLPRQTLQHRGLQQERTHLPGLAVEDLISQVVQHEAMAAAERRDKPGRIRVPPQRQRGQLQSRRPPLGAGRQRHHRSVGQDRPRRRAQQRRRLLGGEAELSGAQLSQLAAGPQPRQRQRRVSPAGHHQQQARWQVLQQKRYRLVHRPGVNQVVVVQDQQHLIPTRLDGEPVDQGRHKPLKRTRGRRPEHRVQPLGDPGLRLIQRSDHVAPEPGRVVVAGIQAQPRHRPPATAGPIGQQRRFAESRRSANQHSSPRQPLAERPHQARAWHKTRLRPRHVQLGRQQGILPGHGSPGRGRRRRVSHRGPTAQPTSEPRSGRWTGPFYGLALPTGPARMDVRITARFHPHATFG